MEETVVAGLPSLQFPKGIEVERARLWATRNTETPLACPFLMRVPLPGVREASKQFQRDLKSHFLDAAIPSSCWGFTRCCGRP